MLATVDRAIYVPYFSAMTVYDDPAPIDLMISSFSPIGNATFLRLAYPLLIHCDTVTTAHAQSNQGHVQII